MNIKSLQRIIVGVVISSAFSLNAQTITFNAATSNAMGVATNYSTGVLPTSTDNLTMTALGVNSGILSVNSLTTSGNGGYSQSSSGAQLITTSDINFGGSNYNGFQGGKVVVGGSLNINTGSFEILSSVNTGTNYTVNGFGDVNVAAGATLRLRLFSTPSTLPTSFVYDFKSINFAAGSNLQVTYEGSYALADRTFNLFNADTFSGAPTVKFTGTGGATLLGNTFAYDSVTKNFVVNAVPEPSTYAMIGVLSLVLLSSALRRKKV